MNAGNADRPVGTDNEGGMERAERTLGVPGIGVNIERARRALGRSGQPVWHREYWDRFIRNKQHFHDAMTYIHHNPVKARLVHAPEDWPWSSAHGNADRPVGTPPEDAKQTLGVPGSGTDVEGVGV